MERHYTALHQPYWLKFSFKSVYISKCYAKNERGCFFEIRCNNYHSQGGDYAISAVFLSFVVM